VVRIEVCGLPFFVQTARKNEHPAGGHRLRDAIFPALIAALVCRVGISLLTKPPRAEQLAQFGD
jgi:hypothetical protein